MSFSLPYNLTTVNIFHFASFVNIFFNYIDIFYLFMDLFEFKGEFCIYTQYYPKASFHIILISFI